MTRFTLMVAMVAMFAGGSVFAMIKPATLPMHGGKPMQGQEGTVKATIVEHGKGTHLHFHNFKGKEGPETLFSFGGTFTLFSLSRALNKAKDVVTSDTAKDLAKAAGNKAMDKVSDAIASGKAEEVIKGAAGMAVSYLAK